MTRETFDRELQHLQDEILVLGSLVEKAIVESVELLKRRDTAGARRLIAEDRRLINEKRFAIESEALTLIATQQPMAGDLRVIAAVIEIAHELEGDSEDKPDDG
jgi:phosphate transport system protein